MKRGDVGMAAALVLFCVAGLFLTTTFREVPAMLSQNVPPTFFPRLVLGALVVLSVALGAVTWRQGPTEREPLAPAVLVTAALFIVVVALIPVLGMRVGVLFAAVALPLYWGERSLVRLGALAVGLPLLVHVVFGVALGIRFP